MDIDRTNIVELESRLAKIDLPDAELEILIQHVRDRLIGHFGNETFDVWQAKWGLSRHGADEFAMSIVADLEPVWLSLPGGAITALAANDQIGTPLTFPWENRY